LGNATQQYGNVASMVNVGSGGSNLATMADNSTAATLTANQLYGKNGTTYFDFRQVRYMPASVP
jgi:hypothetical protein